MVDNSLQVNEATGRVKDIIEDLVCCSDNEEMDIDMIINFSERLNRSVFDRKEAIIVLEQIFRNAPSSVILKGVQLLESLVKNCDFNFHKDADSKEFQDSLLFLLNRKRGKKSFLKKLNQNKKNWDMIEMKVLYLIQLWYDTFMMHEADFPHIMENYKLLRKEGIQFPERDPAEIHMINFSGVKSPIFCLLEEEQMRKSGIIPPSSQGEEGSKQSNYSKFNAQFELNPQNVNLAEFVQILLFNSFIQCKLNFLGENIQIMQALIDGAQFSEDLETEYTLKTVNFLKMFLAKIKQSSKNQEIAQIQRKYYDDILELYNQTKQTIRQYENKLRELQNIELAMQQSAIEEFSKAADKLKEQKNLRNLQNINIAPPKNSGSCQKLSDSRPVLSKCANSQPKSNVLDLLDLEPEPTQVLPNNMKQHQINQANIIQQPVLNNQAINIKDTVLRNNLQIQNKTYTNIQADDSKNQNKNEVNEKQNKIYSSPLQLQNNQNQETSNQQLKRDDFDLFSEFDMKNLKAESNIKEAKSKSDFDDFLDDIAKIK